MYAVEDSSSFIWLKKLHYKTNTYNENTIEQDSKANYVALTAALKRNQRKDLNSI